VLSVRSHLRPRRRFATLLLSTVVTVGALAPGAHALSAADWTRFDLTPAGPSSANDWPSSVTADASGRTTVVWGRVGVHAQSPSGIALLARTRATDGAWSPERTLSAPGEAVVQMAPGADSHAITAANAAGDVAAVWQSCAEAFGSPDDTQCRLRWAVQARGTTTWTVPASVGVGDAPRDASTEPAIAINDEGDVTVAWVSRTGTSRGSASVRTFRNEPGGYVAEPVQTLDALPADLGFNDRWEADTVLLATRADGNAVAAWRRYEHRVAAFSGCSATMTATQRANGEWRTPIRLDDGDCLTASGYGHALARDGDDVLAVYGNLGVATGSDVAVVARRLLADGSRGPATAIGDGVIPWNALIGTWPTANPLVVSATGRAAFLADARTADPTDDERYTPVVWTRASADAAWSRSEPVPGDTYEQWSAGSRTPSVAIEDDGTVTGVWRTTVGVQRIEVVRRVAGEPWSAPLTLSDDEPDTDAYAPVLASRGDGPPLVAWTQGGRVRTSALAGVVNAAPVAAFDASPERPTAGAVVTLTSASTDSDGTIVRHEWDLDDDGEFDVVGATASVRFPDPGRYTVELRVTDDDGAESTAAREVVVEPRPAGPGEPAEPDAPGTRPGDAPGGGDPGLGPVPPPGTPVPVGGTPPPFVVARTIDTAGRRAVPNVIGRSLDDAQAKLVRAVQYVDLRSVREIRDADRLPARPGGGRWRVGDVLEQTPAAGTRLTTSTSAQAAVTLRFWAGEKGDRGRCSELRSTLRKDDLATATTVLRAAGCGSSPDLELVPAKRVAEPTVRQIAKDGDITVAVPTDPAKLDLVSWRGTGILGSTDLGPLAGDFSLTAGQANTIGITLRDRAGRRVKGARIKVDLHETGGMDVSRSTDGSGAFAATVKPLKAGTIHVMSEFADAKGEKIYGYAAFDVRNRNERTLVTAVGNTFTRNDRTGRYELTRRAGSRSAAAEPTGSGSSESPSERVATTRAIDLNGFFEAVASCLRGFGGTFAALPGAAREQVQRATSSMGISVFSLWRGPDAGRTPSPVSVRATTSGVWLLQPNGVVSSGGANVISAGGGNVVSAGGANVVSAGGANVVSAGGLNLLSDNGLGVISAGGGNLVRLPDGSRVVSGGGANVISAGGANVVSAGGANAVSAGGANVVSAGGMN
jgi:hypothetical protein